jgi:hypothetical protein
MIINLFFFSRIDNVNSGEFKWFREQIEEKLSLVEFIPIL